MPEQRSGAFVPLNDKSWTALSGFPGICQLALSGNFNEAARSGRRTRLIRFAPGTKTDRALVHDYHEEAFLLSGDLQEIGDSGEARFVSCQSYAYRPPGTPHGPMRSEHGCVLMEIHYY